MTTSRSETAAAFEAVIASTRVIFPVALAVLVSTLLAACSLTPSGLKHEQARLDEAGRPFEHKPDALPEPSSGSDWKTILQRALLANGDLEGAYFEWKATVREVGAAAGWPNSNLALSYSYLFSGDNVKAFDRMTLSAGLDAMENLSFPTKTKQAGRNALEEARASGERFRAAKFALQRRVLTGWNELALAAEEERLALRRAELAGVRQGATNAATGAGEAMADGVQASVTRTEADDGAARAHADVLTAREELAAMSALEPSARLPLPEYAATMRPIPDDRTLLLAAVGANAELAALEAGVRARQGAVDLARLQWIPDINPLATFSGSAEQMVGAMVVLPTTIAEIRGAISKSRAMLAASKAMLVQARRDRAASFVSTLIALRDAERQVRLLDGSILPALATLASTRRSAYAVGISTIDDVIEIESMDIDARMSRAQAIAAREIRAAELEELAGVDLESIGAEHTARALTTTTPVLAHAAEEHSHE